MSVLELPILSGKRYPIKLRSYPNLNAIRLVPPESHSMKL